MSFIVKGIDLPKDGESIRLVITSSGDVIEVWRDGLAKAYHPNKAIQIPKGHGRLIDEKKVENERYYIHEPYYSYPVIRWGSLHRVPTILEAEEE